MGSISAAQQIMMGGRYWPSALVLVIFQNGSYVPKVAYNCSTINGRFGAISALHSLPRNYRLVLTAVILLEASIGQLLPPYGLAFQGQQCC